MDKFCLQWNEFDANIKDYFKDLREDKRFIDVTLATDDGRQIQAHKIVLSAGSNFFNDIFLKSNHSNMLIYLKGMHSTELELVLDFIYKGEVLVAENELNKFLEIAKELQVRGLQGDLQGVQENGPGTQNVFEKLNAGNFHTRRISIEDEEYREKYLDVKGESSVDVSKCALSKIEKCSVQPNTNYELLDAEILKLIEKRGDLWNCKVCGKTAAKTSNIKAHAEIHIEGMSHDCPFCSKTFSNRNGVRTHIYTVITSRGITSRKMKIIICFHDSNVIDL